MLTGVKLSFSIRAALMLGLLIQLSGVVARAGTAERITFLGGEFVAYRVDLATDELALFWQDTKGKPLETFTRLKAHLAAQSRELKFAINAGIYSREGAPLGLHIEEFKVLRPLNLGNLEGGQWNFYLKPNGVFYVHSNRPGIVESPKYPQLEIRPVLACQSGPLLLNNGEIHPVFRPGSTNLHWRSGVGVTKDHQVVFVLSKNPLCFHDFARLFKEKLACDNALYLDGDICAIYLPELGYQGTEKQTRFAGMFAVMSKPKANP
jgi:uncharacterized protein YigE (DUF2233 family)